MKRVLMIVGLLFGLATGVAQAQTRVGVSLSFGEPDFAGAVVIGRPYYYGYYPYPYYYRYRPGPVIVFGPRYYHAPRVIVVRPYRFHSRRYHRGW
jgi:hypothetical protein